MDPFNEQGKYKILSVPTNSISFLHKKSSFLHKKSMKDFPALQHHGIPLNTTAVHTQLRDLRKNP